jgi:signal transduction histidine kinase
MRTELDVTLRRPDPERLIHMAHVLSDAVDRSEQLVASLLALATSEHGPDNMTHVDLAQTAGDAVRRAEPAARSLGVEIRTAGYEPAPVNGDLSLLDRLVDNLLDNAIRHNHHGGVVELSVTPYQDIVTLTVANTGPIVPDHELETLFEPFHRIERGNKGRGGFGLGLAIVRSATLAHHGEVTAHANPIGGLTITVTLPAATTHEHSSQLDTPRRDRVIE